MMPKATIGKAEGHEDRPIRRRRHVDVVVGVGHLFGEDVLGGGDRTQVVSVALADVFVLAMEELVE